MVRGPGGLQGVSNFLYGLEFYVRGVKVGVAWDVRPSDLYSFRKVTGVKLGKVRSNSRWAVLRRRC